MRLCSFCSKNFWCIESSSDCEICGGRAEEFLKAVSSSSLSIPEGTRFFYVGISTSSLRKEMGREELAFDLCVGKSIKQALHEALISTISQKYSITPSVSKADIVFTYDFPNPCPKVEVKPIYIYGKYSKLLPGISQKRWKKYERSVEASIGEPLKEIYRASNYFMHASGREDVDAINVAPRPFVMELVSPTKRWLDIPSLKVEGVEVDLKGYVPPSFVKLVSDSHFDKSYRAYIDTTLGEKETELLSKFSGVLRQRTPSRVKHRRADIVRERKIYSVTPGKDEKGFYLDIDAEAGTYIKEFISGDGGRTSPSVSELLGREVRCSFLIVTKIKDAFLDFVFEKQRLR